MIDEHTFRARPSLLHPSAAVITARKEKERKQSGILKTKPSSSRIDQMYLLRSDENQSLDEHENHQQRSEEHRPVAYQQNQSIEWHKEKIFLLDQ